MSFITKRERVFHEYDLFDLPTRNEGKLKAYSSCTDARAWSHFCSDKSEHLVEIIKRNNEMCRPKYVPTEAIVNTLLANKHAEIGRLKRKIEEFELMLAAYDELELTCDQKCEIAKAHAAIKEANKDLNELWFDLDLSGFTGIDSEDFETGKSRGDEPSKNKQDDDEGDETPRSKGDEWSFEKEPPQKESKSNQAGALSCCCDASTYAVDPRIQELQDCIIEKDAKLNAMRNTIAVIENDVCEPYCIYAHIYTALEKIFGILCQNDKYKVYLSLMTAGKDTRSIDIKGKILFKLKVLEKFSLALIAPCSQDFATISHPLSSKQECSCFRAEIDTRVEPAFALTSAEIQQPCIDNKRAQLVADIMENEEMKEIISKESTSIKRDADIDDETSIDYIDCYNITHENLKRLKNLQENYDDLMTCYEDLKHEKECLQIRCRKYEELEKEFESLQTQLREYNALWNEKEHYRKRSLDLDTLKEQYMVLCDETTNIERELKAEFEINDVKTKTIEELRNENIALEKRLNEASIVFEKEKNYAQCKLKESECTIMCQGQQIKSLSVQIDRLLEQDPEKLQSKQSETPAIDLINEVNLLKEQIKNLKDALCCNAEEKQQLQEEFQNKLNLINDLKMEIEDWKSCNYEKALNRNDYLEKYTESFRDEVHILLEKNRALSQDVEEKSNAIDDLFEVIKNKSQEIDKLMENIEHANKEKSELYNEIHRLHDAYNKSISTIDTEKSEVMRSLQIARQESHELLEKVKDYEDIVHKQDNLTHEQNEEFNRLKSLLISTQQENNSLQMDLNNRDNNNSKLLEEIQKLQEVNNFAVNNISSLQDEQKQYRRSLELKRKDSKILEDKLQSYEDISLQMQQLKVSHEKLIKEKNRLANELANKTIELDNAIHAIQLTKKKSGELENELLNTENLKADLKSVDDAYKKLIKEQQRLQSELDDKKQGFDNLLDSFNNLKNNLKRVNDQTSEEVDALSRELDSLKKSYNQLLAEKNVLQNDYYNKTEEIHNLHNNLESKIEENRELILKLKQLEQNHKSVQSSMTTLQEDHFSTQNTLNALRKDSDELMRRVKYYEMLESEYDQLKKEHDQVKDEKNILREELQKQIAELKRIEEDNRALNSESQHLLSHSEDLEKALIDARTELIVNTSSPKSPHIDIVKEIEQMRREKLSNHKRIRELLDKLDESEITISDLSEDILARDDRISILENHINDLQDEVRRLHSSLEEIVDTGEQIKDNSYQKIRESLNTMDAHHSKATHNMKMELAKLQSDNMKLEERLSISKIKSEDSARDKHKYISQIIHLQNEREIIVTDIKQLEINSVGDSALSPANCDVEDILGSLDRIRRYLDARSSKSTSLEQTLLKVQNSYQVVQSKADEAKKIVEKEKQKILNEKEEAIRDRVNMEKQLTDLKEQLEKQVTHDKNVIKDLEAEILNQKLIFDKLNKSTQSYISKLKEEMRSLEALYQKSLENISDLEERQKLMSEQKNIHLDIIEEVNSKLEEKCKEIEILKHDFEKFKTKPNHSLGTQALLLNNRDEETQTNQEFQYEGFDQYDEINKTKDLNKNQDFNTNLDLKKTTAYERKLVQKDKIKHVNEIQVLTANVEPTFDYVRNSYLNYKLKHLSPGRLEQYSISCISENDIEFDSKDITMPSVKISDKDYITNKSTENMNVIDIYNKQSMHTNSSKIIDSNYPENERNDVKSPAKTSAITDFGLTIESFDAKSSTHKASNLFGSVSGISTDKDLFVIYKDSETYYTPKSYDKKSWPTNDRSEILVKSENNHSDKNNQTQSRKKNAKNKQKQYDIDNDIFLYPEDDEINEDDSVKPKLKISLPRVETDSPTTDTASDGDKKSLDSYTMNMYPGPKSTYSSSDHKMEKGVNINSSDLKGPSVHSISNAQTQYMESYISTTDKNRMHPTNILRSNFIMPSGSSENNELSNENTDHDFPFPKKQLGNVSHHKLSRIDADVRLIKSKATDSALTENKNIKDKVDNFGLDYILATVQVDPDNIKTYNAASSLRKSRSVELFNSMKFQGKSDSSPSRSTEQKKSSTDYKTVTSNNQYSFNSQSKTYTERSIMVKLDPIEEYEKKIKNLTNNLENIEKDYKKKIEAIKMQYDNNIKSILNEHNEGVKSIQALHEETLQDIVKNHENEVENLRSMSIDAMRKADKLEKEVWSLKCKMPVCSSTYLNEEPTKMSTFELKKHRKSRIDSKTLTKTNVEAFNVRPKSRSNGPCTCSLDINISDTIRNIFEQVDVDQRKVAEHTYLKYIANKILNNTVEALDCQELSFLHLKVCRIWKVKLTKEESLQKKIGSMEAELMNKQRNTQVNMAELDRKVAEERRRLQEVREAVCRNVPTASRYDDAEKDYVPAAPPTVDTDFLCNCNNGINNLNVGERRSAGDLAPTTNVSVRSKRVRPESNRAVLAKLDAEERREKKLYNNEPPTRLRRLHDRPPMRTNKK